MSLTKEDIDKIAKLSRIELSDEEGQKMAGDLSAILDYFKELQALDTSSVNLDLSEQETSNQMRTDEPQDSGIQKDILENAPAKEDNYIKVKSVF